MLEEVSSNVKAERALERLSGEEIKESQSNEARLVPEELWLEDRELSLTLGYLIPKLNFTKAKPGENVMKLTNKKKRENAVHEFLIFSKELYKAHVFSNWRNEKSMFDIFLKT